VRELDQIRDAGRTGDTRGGEALVQCPVCDTYLRKNEGFICPRCKRGPLCRRHRVRGKRECEGCVLEIQAEELGDLRRQEASIKSFLRLLQFLFIVFAIVFIALRTGVTETIEFLRYSFIPQSLELLGGLSVVGYVLFYLILYNQRQRIRGLESEMNDSRFRRFAR
jgi:uncharacterized protein (DUF983 family)